MTPKELTRLAQDLSRVGPGWSLLVGAEDVLSALRLGTSRVSAAGRDAAHLLAEVEAAEERIEANRARVAAAGVGVQIGLANTHTMRPLRGK